jgi:phage terminase large subunit-like protein
MHVELFDLEQWQRDLFSMYESKPRDTWFVVKAKRQCGKSVAMEALLIAASLKRSNSFSLFVSPVIQQARKVFQDVQRIAYQLITNANASVLEITFCNGSVIKFGSSQQADSLRGFTVKNTGVLVIDEAAFCSDDVFYQILVPTTNVFRSDIFIVSTPKFKQGFFFNLYLKGLEGDGKVLSVDWNTYDTSKYLPNETLEIYRQQMPRLAFQSEFLAEFIDGDGAVFTNFKQCVGACSLHADVPTVVGIDWGTGTGGDYTVLTTGQVYDGKACIVAQTAFNDKNATETIRCIVEHVARLKGQNIRDVECIVEKNSIGQVYLQLLNDALPDDVQLVAFNTSNKSKDRIIKQVIALFERQRIAIPNDTRLLNELTMYACEVNSNGLPIYSAPSGYHDDRVMSLCFAVERMYIDV